MLIYSTLSFYFKGNFIQFLYLLIKFSVMDDAINGIRKLVEDDLALMNFADEKFEKTDKDGNGKIDFEELKNAMADIADELGYSEPSDEVVQQTFLKFDKDRSMVLEKEEFRLFIKSVLNTFLIAFDEDF